MTQTAISEVRSGISTQWPLFVAPAAALALAAGAARSLAWDLDGAGEGLVATLAPLVFGACALVAILGLVVAAPPKLRAPFASLVVAILLISSAAGVAGRTNVPPLAAIGQASQPLFCFCLAAAGYGYLRPRLALRSGVGGALRDWGSWILLSLGALAATAAYVWSSERILSWDPIQYWTKTDWVAANILVDPAGALRAAVLSVADEYSMLPALLPGALTAFGPRHFLLAYMLAIALSYLVPALFGCGALGFALARDAEPTLAAASSRQRMNLIAMGALSASALLPAFLRGFLDSAMLDVGGVALVAALALLWNWLARLLRPSDHGDETTHFWSVFVASAAIAASALLLFAFRRSFVFDVIGFSGAALLYLAYSFWRERRIPWRDLTICIASALLVVVAFGEWMLVQWIGNAGKRNYAESYAGFWLGWPDEIGALYASFGVVAPLICIFGLWRFMRRATRGPLAFVLLFGTLLALIGFFSVQGMSPHHYYVFLPALAASAAALGVLAARRYGSARLLIAVTALSVFMSLAPRMPELSWAQPSEGLLLPKRTADADEFRRLGHWLDRELAADERYCLAGSSWRLNGSVTSNIWQIDSSLFGGAAQEQEIVLPGVDSRDGPPRPGLKDCAIILATAPPQTHVRPEEQQTILLVNADLLSGEGVGRAYRRMDETFNFTDGLTLFAYRRVRPITDEELSDLRRRFYATKGRRAQRYIERFGEP